MRYDRLISLICLGIGILLAVYVWPGSPAKNSADHVEAAINDENSATAIINEPGDTLSESDWQAIVSYHKKALGEAQQANIADMNSYYPGFGDHFRDEFIGGLKLILNNSEQISQAPAFLQGQVLVDRWGAWYDASYDAIHNKK